MEVPLPYLLYRVNARFEEDLRGLKDIQGALSPSGSQPPLRPFEIPPVNKPFPTDRSASRLANSPHLTGAGRPLTPLGVRARLSSLNSNSSHQPRKATSSSTLTSQGQKKSFAPLSPTSASSPEDTDSEDEALRKEEDADRAAEEQELLDRKLQQLQMMMTNEALGLVSSLRPRNKGKASERGKAEPETRRQAAGSERRDRLSNRSNSQSVSSASSLQGSIADIPSPPETQSRPPLSRRMSYRGSTSPPAVSQGTALGQRYRPLADRSLSEQSSSHGSEASSFSDLSGKLSVLVRCWLFTDTLWIRCEPFCISVGKCTSFEHSWQWFTFVSPFIHS